MLVVVIKYQIYCDSGYQLIFIENNFKTYQTSDNFLYLFFSIYLRSHINYL